MAVHVHQGAGQREWHKNKKKQNCVDQGGLDRTGWVEYARTKTRKSYYLFRRDRILYQVNAK